MISPCRKLQIDLYLLPCTKLKSRWIKDLNIKPTILNLIEEKVENTLEHMGIGDHFLNIAPVSETLRSTINKWELLKLRNIYKAKYTCNKTKLQPTELEKIFRHRTDVQNIQRTQET